MHFKRFGGDNRDQGKGFVFHSLGRELRDFHVDPMITDADLPAGPLREGYVEGYRRFLRLSDSHQIVNSALTYCGNVPVMRNGKSESYFKPHFDMTYDLFLDPDTGIASGGREYVPRGILSMLLPEKSDRVLLIYVSANRNGRDWRWLLSQLDVWFKCPTRAFVCDLGGNGILFLSNQWNDRLKFMRGALRNAFGPFAEWRITDYAVLEA